MNTIEKLIAHIVSECKPVDREERFNAMLDEIYSFDSVGGPFAHMSPSQVLLEMDPTAHRCGVNDYADGEGWVEVDGEDYEGDDVDKAREEFVDNLNSELQDAQTELEEAEEEDPDAHHVELKAKVDELEAAIKEAEGHTF